VVWKKKGEVRISEKGTEFYENYRNLLTERE
jgi:predicted transcriptional regulator